MRALLLVLPLLSLSTFAQNKPPAAEMLELAMKGYSLASSAYRSGGGDLDAAARWSKRVYELQKAARAPKADDDYVYRMKDLEKVATGRVNAGTAQKIDQVEATWLRLEAEAAVKK